MFLANIQTCPIKGPDRDAGTLDARVVKLQEVHGYSGLENTAPNIFYTATPRADGGFSLPAALVYYTAAVGV